MKTLRSGSLALLLCVLLFKTNAQTATVPPGAGTEISPYLISTADHLYWLSQNPTQWVAGKYFLQTGNIDANGTATWDASKGFKPIGTSTSITFNGTYDGGGFTISRLQIRRPNTSGLAMFGYVGTSGIIKNLTMSQPYIYGAGTNIYDVAVFAGWNNGKVINCHTISGTVTGPSNGSYYDLYRFGGIVGYNINLVENCSSSANLYGSTMGGGIAGANIYGTIRNCVSSGTVNAASTAGGLVGYVYEVSTLTDCYSSANVSGTEVAGGAIGGIGNHTINIRRCYSTGRVTGSNLIGGFAGYNYHGHAVTACFWDTQTSARSTSAAGTGRTTAQMKLQSTYTGWDFMCETANGTADLWVLRAAVNNGYPTLAWQGGYSDNCNVWLGTNNSTWTQANNWSLNMVPADGAEVLIASTAVADLHLDRARNVSRLVFPATGGRHLIVGNYDLTISGSSTGSTSSFAKTNGTGRLVANIANAASVNFPIGTDSYTPVSITNLTGAADLFSVGISNGVKEEGTSGGNYSAGGHVLRTWDIHKQNPNAGSGINMTLQWNTADVTGLFTSPILFHYGNKWERLKGNYVATSNSLTYNNYTGGFSPFAILDVTTTLPVSWGNVSAQKQRNKALVKWSTLTEEQTELFQVQHSTNGRDWKSLQTVAAAGNSNTVKNYQYLHEQPAGGINYYRIMQQDIDGRQSYSKIVSLQMSESRATISVFPNPTTNGRVTVTTATTGNLQVFNNTGALVKQVKVNAGNNSIDLSALPKGVYRLKLGDESASLLIK